MSSILWQYPSRLFGNVREHAVMRVLRWARKRQGSDDATTKLRPGRVYILPTGVGLIYGLMAFAMMLGSMNYNNNLSFVLTIYPHRDWLCFHAPVSTQPRRPGIELRGHRSGFRRTGNTLSRRHHQSVQKCALRHSYLSRQDRK